MCTVRWKGFDALSREHTSVSKVVLYILLQPLYTNKIVPGSVRQLVWHPSIVQYRKEIKFPVHLFMWSGFSEIKILSQPRPVQRTYYDNIRTHFLYCLNKNKRQYLKNVLAKPHMQQYLHEHNIDSVDRWNRIFETYVKRSNFICFIVSLNVTKLCFKRHF